MFIFRPDPLGFVTVLMGLLVWVLADRISRFYFYGLGERSEQVGYIVLKTAGALMMLVGAVSTIGWLLLLLR